MRRAIKLAYTALTWLGIDPMKPVFLFRHLPGYVGDFRELHGQRHSAVRRFPVTRWYPCFGDKAEIAGGGRGYYFHQDLLVARRIHERKPRRHIDVASRIDGFVAHVASFRTIEVCDVRPLPGNIPNLIFRQVDFTAPLPSELIACCDSLSCLHSLEHFGLGRYGDAVEYDGYLGGLRNFHATLEPGGMLYLSVPIGPQRIEFNAHRVFDLEYLLECFEGLFRVDGFSYVDDGGDLHEDVPITGDDARNNFGCHFGCGILELTKVG